MSKSDENTISGILTPEQIGTIDMKTLKANSITGVTMSITGVTMTDDERLENELKAKGKTAPRITPDHISHKIKDVHFFTAADGITGAFQARREAGDTQTAVSYPEALSRLTFCVITLENGFTVTGQSACASPENFDASIGNNLAFEDAKRQIWKLEGYLLRETLHALETGASAKFKGDFPAKPAEV